MMGILTKSLYLAIGDLVQRKIMTFTPALLASEICRGTDHPEDFVVGRVIQECEKLVNNNLLWSPGPAVNKPAMQEYTCLVANEDRLLRALDHEMATA